MQDLRRRFGRLVAANRKKAGMTQEVLAEASGVSRDMISRIEAGATGVRFATIEKLSTALGVDPAELFTPELAVGARQRAALSNLTARLAALSDKDLAWVTALLDTALKSR
ncbi:MAG: family transcriptional regulator [Caulobacter sp.]|nr:family transcriptional regulator [Caulobacter sp.]